MWGPAARSIAAMKYDERVVEIFYDGLESTRTDFSGIRDSILPLPTLDEGFPRVLLLGTTGAGKTTVVRQLLGTDPNTERFPSTSTAKTTIAETELIIGGSSEFSAVVTFSTHDEIVDSLSENVVEAAIAVFNGKNDDEVQRKLLDHLNQRHRFSYILGRGAAATTGDDDDYDDDELPEVIDDSAFDGIDMAATAAVLRDCTDKLKAIVAHRTEYVRAQLEPSSDDERTITELIEDEIQNQLHEAPEFHQIVDKLMDEMELRFDHLDPHQLRRNRQGWPVSWHCSTDDRASFIKTIMRFSSNQASQFGSLLTPLVNGIRVAGPFKPTWMADMPRLVLIDGEGLGHTPGSASTLSTSVAKQVESVDAVVLVDNAQQPMQAAPLAAMRSLAVSGMPRNCTFCSHISTWSRVRTCLRLRRRKSTFWLRRRTYSTQLATNSARSGSVAKTTRAGAILRGKHPRASRWRKEVAKAHPCPARRSASLDSARNPGPRDRLGKTDLRPYASVDSGF